MNDSKPPRFYTVHMGGGRFETWCQDHARRDLERGKRLREVPGPCAVCAGQVETLPAHRLRAAGDLDHATRAIPVALLEQLDPLVARLLAAVELHDQARDEVEQARAGRERSSWGIDLEDAPPAGTGGPFLVLLRTEREVCDAAAALAAWWRS